MVQKYRYAAILVYIFFILVTTGLPFYSFEGYSILSNTTSHLGAQGSPHAWLMNLVFWCLGVMAILITYVSRIRFHQIVGALFGISLILTGVFPHAPLVDSVLADQLQDQLHSIFASTTGFSFTFLAIGHGFMSKGRQRSGGITMAFIATLISLGMMMFPPLMGLLQRVMFVCTFGWLFFYMKPPQDMQARNKRNKGTISY